MRALIISDIHGNIDVLRALELEWGHRFAGFDRVICLGDLVDYGPYPADAIDWVRAKATDVVCGNHDHAMATGAPCGSAREFLEASTVTRQNLRPVLTPGEVEYLRDLPRGGTATVGTWVGHLVHAVPAEPLHRYVLPDAPEPQWISALDGLLGKTVLVGHTHFPFARSVAGGLVINPGSIGMPKDGDPHGSYAIVEDGQVFFRRVAYDPEPMIARLRSLDLPERVLDQLTRAFRTGR